MPGDRRRFLGSKLDSLDKFATSFAEEMLCASGEPTKGSIKELSQDLSEARSLPILVIKILVVVLSDVAVNFGGNRGVHFTKKFDLGAVLLKNGGDDGFEGLVVEKSFEA